MSIAVGLSLTPAQVRELTYDELEAYVAVHKRRQRRAARAARRRA